MTASFSINVTQKVAKDRDLAIGLFLLSKQPARFEPTRECVRSYYIRPSTEIDGTKMTGAIEHRVLIDIDCVLTVFF